MKDFFKRHLIVIIISITGGIGGFLYWKFVGCLSGSCPIKSVWYLSTFMGLALGYLAGSISKDLIMKIKDKKKTGRDNNIVEK